MNAAGIDVSSRKSTVAVLRPFGEVVELPFDVQHSAEALAALAEHLKSIDGETRVVMEHTGRYYESVAKVLHEAGIFVSAVNPLLIKEYGNNSLRRVKTDKADAIKIARYALDNWAELRDYTPMDTIRYDLKTLNRQFQLASKQRTAAANNLIALQEHSPFPESASSLTALYAATARIGDVRRFRRKQSLVAFAGIDPMPNQSGEKNVRSNKSSKRGSLYLRKTLFNIMTVYLQKAPADEPVYQFLDRKRAEGKPYYVYMTAAGNKFLRRYYAKVMNYFATLENLPPVDMDSTGLQHAE